MTRELAKAYDATFVESLGLRRPELRMNDFRRILKRVSSNQSTPATQRRPLPPSTRVVSPVVIPMHSRPFQGVNRKLLLRGGIKEWAQSDSARVFWTYSPVTYGLEEFADVAIYHCVDLLGEFPGIDRNLVDHNERRLAEAGVLAAASSEVVLEHLRNQGFRDPVFWPNVADAETIIESSVTSTAQRAPSAVFAGNFTTKKVNFLLLRELLEAGVNLDLAGPVSQGGGDSQEYLEELVSLGAKYHGMLPLESLAQLMASNSVGLIPYELNAYTRGVSPLKVYEYLAAGLRVVSTPIPSVEAIEGHVSVAASNQGFVLAVVSGIGPGDGNSLQERALLAKQHSWAGRGEEARELLSSMLVRAPTTTS
ncbi:glycosyltransferase [Pseudarthrobacter sp. S9]|uniref:glycosyltransferase n=1 Tax=Pseudarthrobacter sp. S9 TaxID=3418421 RepID=UPI003CFD0973